MTARLSEGNGEQINYNHENKEFTSEPLGKNWNNQATSNNYHLHIRSNMVGRKLRF